MNTPQKISEAQKLALLESERRVAIAIFNWLNARARALEFKDAEERSQRLLIHVGYAVAAIVISYVIAQEVFTDLSLSPTTELGAALFLTFVFYYLVRDRSRVGIWLVKARREEQSWLAEIESYDPLVSHNLQDDWGSKGPLTISEIKQEPGFNRVRSRLARKMFIDVNY